MDSSGLPQVDNTIYDELGEQWYSSYDNPIALLRAESKTMKPWIHQRIQKYFVDPQACHILDVGCGAGFLSNSLAQQGYGVTGVDLSSESLQVARQHDSTHSVHYRNADAYHLPFSDKSFEVVTAMDFLEHVEHPAQAIQEAARVLKPGGLFFFHTFNRNWLSNLVVIHVVERFFKNAPKNIHVLRLFITPEEMRDHCQMGGLKVQEITGLRPNIQLKHLPAVFRRAVPEDFSFTLTPSLRISYLGYALNASS